MSSKKNFLPSLMNCRNTLQMQRWVRLWTYSTFSARIKQNSNPYRNYYKQKPNKKTNMRKYNYELEIAASNEKEADVKMEALTILAAKLNAKELEKLGYIVKNDPIKTAMAKKA